MKKIIALLIIACLLCSVFVACKNEPKTIYESNSVKIVSSGKNTTVYDICSNKEYNYTVKRVRRSESNFEAYTSVDTDTVKIDILPLGGLSIHDKQANKIFTIKRKSIF